MTRNPFNTSFEALPEILPIFPLAGATLLPGTQLPLNIFEPRYLAMIEDALGHGRLLGMVQPDTARSSPSMVVPYRIGCAGRITSFNESDDGRFLITLSGLCRFELAEELPLERGYRRVRAVYTAFAGDMLALDDEDTVVGLDRQAFRSCLETYLASSGISIDWRAVDDLTDRQLVDVLAVQLPFSVEEKQALIEAQTATERAQVLAALTEMGSRAGGSAPTLRH